MGHAPPRPSRLTAEPYAGPDELRADLLVLARALAKGSEAMAGGGALGRLIRHLEVFGFHGPTLDLRQNSAVHERTVAELFSRAGVEADYLALDEEARVALLSAELRQNRPLGGALGGVWGGDGRRTRHLPRRRRRASAVRAGLHHDGRSSP